MGRREQLHKALCEKIDDELTLLARGSIDAKRLTRDHLYTLITQRLNPMGWRWDEVNAWFEENRPEVPLGREV